MSNNLNKIFNIKFETLSNLITVHCFFYK